MPVAVIVKVPALEKLCSGLGRVDVLLAPEDGSPKFQLILLIT